MRNKILMLLVGVLFAANAKAQLTDSTLTITPEAFVDSVKFEVHYLTLDTVNLLIFNRWGEVVGQLYHDSVFTGHHARFFDGTELPQETYAYVLTVNGDTQNGYVSKIGATSVEERNNIAATFYPNPTNDQFFVNAMQPTEVKLYSLSGTLLQKWSLKESGICELKPQLKGAYLLQIGGRVEKIMVE